MGNEAYVEVGIVRDKRSALRKFAELLQYDARGRRALHHGFRDAGQLGDVFRNRQAVVDKGLEPLCHSAVFDANRADLDDLVMLRL